MANECQFCGVRRPAATPRCPAGTRMIVMNLDGQEGAFVEFCDPCGDSETISNGERTITLHQLFEECEAAHKASEIPPGEPGSSLHGPPASAAPGKECENCHLAIVMPGDECAVCQALQRAN